MRARESPALKSMVTDVSVYGPEVSYTGRFGSPAPSLSMISRKGTRTSAASSGVTKILRDDGSGPVVTAGFSSAELTGLFMVLLPSGVLGSFQRRYPNRQNTSPSATQIAAAIVGNCGRLSMA